MFLFLFFFHQTSWEPPFTEAGELVFSLHTQKNCFQVGREEHKGDTKEREEDAEANIDFEKQEEEL
jgi:hypothetical protein